MPAVSSTPALAVQIPDAAPDDMEPTSRGRVPAQPVCGGLHTATVPPQSPAPRGSGTRPSG
jgi:hypothetical protein